MGADARCFGQNRNIDMGHNAAARPQQLHGFLHKNGGRCALPLLVSWREMLANVALADTAKYGVGDRMKCHVGIRVTFQFVGVRDFYTTQGHAISFFKNVIVDAMAGSHVGALFEQSIAVFPVSFLNVVLCCKFSVALFTRNDLHFQSGIFCHCCIIGKTGLAGGMGFLVGLQNAVIMETLWCLDKP